EVVDGNDPVASWQAIKRAMHHCRTTRRPFMLEALVSRLHGHSSSSGAARVKNEPDCVELFEQKPLTAGVAGRQDLARMREEAYAEADQAAEQASRELRPRPEDVELHTFAPSKVDAVYPGDYTGLP